MIEAHELTRRFGEALAVDRLVLRVPAGAAVALLGPNGAGKTTAVRMLAGLLAPSAGTATVAGRDVRTDPAGVRLRVGLVTDVPGLHEQMTLTAYLDFYGRLYGVDEVARRQRIAALLALFDLDAHGRERMVGFSKGMKQKAALARALLHEPAVLFLDEPTSGLDPLGARAVRDLIRGLKAANRAIVLCTHDLDDAERLADEVAILRAGRVVARGTPGELRASAAPQTLVRVDLAATCPGAVAALAGVAGVAGPALTAGPAGPDTAVTFSASRPSEVNPRAIAALVAAGAPIVAVASEARTLEDVYAAAVAEDGRLTALPVPSGGPPPRSGGGGSPHWL